MAVAQGTRPVAIFHQLIFLDSYFMYVLFIQCSGGSLNLQSKLLENDYCNLEIT